MKRILVPTDFSKESEYALKVAASLAEKHKAEIYLLHILELPLHLATTAEGELPEAFFFIKLARQKFDTFSKLPYLKDIKTHEIIESSNIHIGITNAIETKEIDFIVMGSSGSSGLEEIFIGSNTEKVVRTSPVPVLIIKEDLNELNVEDFVYACDFKEDAFDAYTRAVEFGNKLNATIHLLLVNTPNKFLTTLEAEEKIKSFTLKQKPTDYTINIYNDKSIEEGIINFSKSVNAGLIGLSTHGRKGIAHFFNGSITEDLANHAIKPVITFKI